MKSLRNFHKNFLLNFYNKSPINICKICKETSKRFPGGKSSVSGELSRKISHGTFEGCSAKLLEESLSNFETNNVRFEEKNDKLVA